MSYWVSDPLIYALDAQGSLVHVDSVANGVACGCACPACGQPLVAKNGGAKLVHHFAHKQGACRWAAEAAVIMLARQILLQERRLFVEGAGYMDMCEDCWRKFKPDGWLEVCDVHLENVDGRQAPIMRLACVNEDGQESRFVLMAALARPASESMLDAFRYAGTDVLAIDLRSAYASMRDTEGRHFSRGEFYFHVQDPEYLRAVLLYGDREDAIVDGDAETVPAASAMQAANAAPAAPTAPTDPVADGAVNAPSDFSAGSEQSRSVSAGPVPTDVLRWLVHPRCEEAERESYKRYRRQIQERVLAQEREFQRQLEIERQEAERQRAEEARRRAEAREQAIAYERCAFEAEGVEALLKVRHGINYYIDDCPLWGQADVVADCGANVFSPNKCIFFEGQRYYTIGCTAWQNGVGLE